MVVIIEGPPRQTTRILAGGGVAGVRSYQFVDGTIVCASAKGAVDNMYYNVVYSDVWNARVDPTEQYNNFG